MGLTPGNVVASVAPPNKKKMLPENHLSQWQDSVWIQDLAGPDIFSARCLPLRHRKCTRSRQILQLHIGENWRRSAATLPSLGPRSRSHSTIPVYQHHYLHELGRCLADGIHRSIAVRRADAVSLSNRSGGMAMTSCPTARLQRKWTLYYIYFFYIQIQILYI